MTSRRWFLCLTIAVATCFLTGALNGRVVEKPPTGDGQRFLPRKPYGTINGAICKREAYPAGTPLSGCRTDSRGRTCGGSCYVHTLTLYLGSCYPKDSSSECTYKPVNIRVAGRKGACRIDSFGQCGCPLPDEMTPYQGAAEVFDC